MRKTKSVKLQEYRSLIFKSHRNYQCVPKQIWIFWDSEEIPEIITKCINRIKLLHPEYKLNLLDTKNISNYIDVDVESLVQIMPIANLSDLIRLKLLYKYGGVWMDASIIFEKSLDEFFLTNEYCFDLTCYYNGTQTQTQKSPVIESWLLAAPEKSIFIAKWLEIYEPVERLGSSSYFDLMKSDPDFDEFSSGLTNPEYLIVYLAARKTFKEIGGDLNIKLIPCDQSAFAVSIYSKWKTRYRIVNFFIKDKFIDSPIHKLTSGEREYYLFLRRNKIINPRSIVGQFLGDYKND